MSEEEFATFEGLEDEPAGDEAGGDGQHDGYANGGQEQHADAEMAEAQDHEQHTEQEQQQQYPADMQDNEQHQQQQQHLHATDSAGLQHLGEDEQPSKNASAAAEADARRISAANSEAAEDNLLSGLADDNDDDIDLPKPAAAGTSSGTPTAAAAAASGEDGGPSGDANKPVTEYELNILKLRAEGKPLNARQRRTLNRLLTRQQGQEAAAKLGLDVNSLLEAQAEEQQQQGQQQGQQQQQGQGQSKAPQPPPSPKVNSTVLYVSNLHWWTTDATVEAAAAAFGPVVSCRFLEERVSGKSRGTACVEFAEPEAAKRCKAEMHGTQLDGRDVVVAWAAPGNFGMFAKQHGNRNFTQQQHFAAAGMGQGMGQMGAGFAGRGPGGPGFAAGAAFAGRGGRGGAAMAMAGRGGRGGRMGGMGMGPMGAGMGMGPPMGAEGGMGMNPMGAAAFAGNMANPMMAAQMMMMAQMAQSAMGMGGRGMGGMGGGYGGMGPGGGMMGGGGFMGGEEEQDFKRQRR